MTLNRFCVVFKNVCEDVTDLPWAVIRDHIFISYRPCVGRHRYSFGMFVCGSFTLTFIASRNG